MSNNCTWALDKPLDEIKVVLHSNYYMGGFEDEVQYLISRLERSEERLIQYEDLLKSMVSYLQEKGLNFEEILLEKGISKIKEGEYERQ